MHGRSHSQQPEDGEGLVWSFWIFIWVSAIMIWFRCLFDLFSDHTLSGWRRSEATVPGLVSAAAAAA